jgi:hypothetical protein
MKKYLKMLLALIMVVTLTGCLKYNVNMEVSDDKSVSLEMIYAMNTSYMDDFNMDMDAEDEIAEEDDEEEVSAELEEEEEEEPVEKEDENPSVKKEDYEWLEKKGYKVEDYEYEDKEGNKYVGIKVKKTFDSIDDIAKEDEKTVNFTEMFEDKDKFDDSQFFSKKGNEYTANFVFDFTQDGEDVSEQYKDYAKMFDLKYEVKLPREAKDNNASKVSDDKKTYTWNLTYGKKNTVNYTFELGSSKKLAIIIIIAVVVVAAVACCVAVILSKKKQA